MFLFKDISGVILNHFGLYLDLDNVFLVSVVVLCREESDSKLIYVRINSESADDAAELTVCRYSIRRNLKVLELAVSIELCLNITVLLSAVGINEVEVVQGAELV